MFIGKFLLLNAYIRKEKNAEINELKIHFKKLEKKDKMDSKKVENGNNKEQILIKYKTNIKINKSESWLNEKLMKLIKPW